MITCACVESPHYLSCFVVCLPNLIKTDQNTWLESLYNVLPVLQKFHVFTHFNAIKHSIEIFGSYRFGKNCSADNHNVIDILIPVYVHRIY